MGKQIKSSTNTEFRPLVDINSKFKPMKQIFNGYEIENRQVLHTMEKDHTKKGNGLILYDEVLQHGVIINQGYIKDIQVAVNILNELGISLNDFQPNTIRFREFGEGYKSGKVSPCKYVLTLKDRKQTKKREVEFKLKRTQFEKYWPMTEGARVMKKRMKKKIKGHLFEVDAFIDRVLLIAECEVTKEEDLAKVPKLGMEVTGNKDWTNKTLAR